MQRNFYKRDGTYYYTDNNQQIYDEAELAMAAKTGKELPDPGDLDNSYNRVVAENPAIKNLLNGGSSLEEIIHGLETGDLSGITRADGQPFSVDEQQKALARAQEDIKAEYEMDQKLQTNITENKLAQAQDDYQNFLFSEGDKFKADKSTMDQKAADSGVLFSGSRAQKQRALENSYNQNQAYADRAQARNIDNLALDYQSKYGDEAARGLGKYYKVEGGNKFNAGVARGGVGTSGISSIYNTGTGYGIGSVGRDRNTNAHIRAGQYLKNLSNKTVETGYNNQL